MGDKLILQVHKEYEGNKNGLFLMTQEKFDGLVNLEVRRANKNFIQRFTFQAQIFYLESNDNGR